MHCPACKSDSNKVIDSRVTEGGSAIRRRRVCTECTRRFTTKERVEAELRLMVEKAGGRRVPYNRANLMNGIQRACYKLEITDAQIARLVDHIEEDIFANHERDVPSEAIGQFVGRHLRKLHPVAYVRFMSVHRKYASVDEFIEEIKDVRVRVAQDSPQQQSLFEA